MKPNREIGTRSIRRLDEKCFPRELKLLTYADFLIKVRRNYGVRLDIIQCSYPVEIMLNLQNTAKPLVGGAYFVVVIKETYFMFKTHFGDAA